MFFIPLASICIKTKVNEPNFNPHNSSFKFTSVGRRLATLDGGAWRQEQQYKDLATYYLFFLHRLLDCWSPFIQSDCNRFCSLRGPCFLARVAGQQSARSFVTRASPPGAGDLRREGSDLSTPSLVADPSVSGHQRNDESTRLSANFVDVACCRWVRETAPTDRRINFLRERKPHLALTFTFHISLRFPLVLSWNSGSRSEEKKKWEIDN